MQAGNRSRGEIGNMKKTIVLGMLLVILLVPNVQGATWIRSCINDTHMYEEAVLNVSDVLLPINQLSECKYNCSNVTSKCNPSEKDVNSSNISIVIAVLISISIMFLLIFYLIKDKHQELGIMFLVIPMFIMLAAIYLSSMLFTSTTQEPIQNLVTTIMFVVGLVSIVTIFYILVKYIKALLSGMLNKDKEIKEL